MTEGSHSGENSHNTSRVTSVKSFIPFFCEHRTVTVCAKGSRLWVSSFFSLLSKKTLKDSFRIPSFEACACHDPAL